MEPYKSYSKLPIDCTKKPSNYLSRSNYHNISLSVVSIFVNFYSHNCFLALITAFTRLLYVIIIIIEHFYVYCCSQPVLEINVSYIYLPTCIMHLTVSLPRSVPIYYRKILLPPPCNLPKNIFYPHSQLHSKISIVSTANYPFVSPQHAKTKHILDLGPFYRLKLGKLFIVISCRHFNNFNRFTQFIVAEQCTRFARLRCFCFLQYCVLHRNNCRAIFCSQASNNKISKHHTHLLIDALSGRVITWPDCRHDV